MEVSTQEFEALKKRLADAESQLAARIKPLTLRVSEKGALSVYGLGAWPVTLYSSQWDRLIEAIPKVKAFLVENKDKFSTKAATK